MNRPPKDYDLGYTPTSGYQRTPGTAETIYGWFNFLLMLAVAALVVYCIVQSDPVGSPYSESPPASVQQQ